MSNLIRKIKEFITPTQKEPALRSSEDNESFSVGQEIDSGFVETLPESMPNIAS